MSSDTTIRVVTPGQALTFSLTNAPTGQAANYVFTLYDSSAQPVTPLAVVIAESMPGVYVASLAAPMLEGVYQGAWTLAGQTAYDPVLLQVTSLSAPAIPTVTDIRNESDVAFDEYNYPLPAAGQVDRLEAKRLDAIGDFQTATGVDPVTVAADSPYVRSIRRVIRLMTEYGVSSNTQEIAETVGDFDLLSSYSIGPYSESRRDRFASRISPMQLHPDPRINRLLVLIRDGLSPGDEGDLQPDIAFAEDNPAVLLPGQKELGRYRPPGTSPVPAYDNEWWVTTWPWSW